MRIKQRFKSSIKRGTGEAHILIKENPTVDFSKAIIKSATFNFAYDQQCEGSRDFYIAELIELSAQKDEILPVLFNALKNEETEDWSTEHLFDVIAVFAKKGDQKAKQIVYECFDRYARKGDWFGDDAIVEIDGLNGLIHVAEKKGEFLSENSDECEHSFFVDNFQEENPSLDVYGALRQAAEKNPFVGKYLEVIEKNKFGRSKWTPPVIDYRYIREKIDAGKNVYLSTRAIEDLSKGDLEKLADEFLREKQRSRQEKYLSVFSCVKFPYDYQPLLELAKAKIGRKDRLVEFAVEALRFFSGKDIRQLALEKLAVPEKPDIFAPLLVENYQDGDWRLLKSIAEKYTNDDLIHSLAITYIEIYRATPTPECREPLEAIYDKLNCGLHRPDLVEILIENDCLSERIRNEMQFDSSERIREIHAAGI